MNCIIVDDDEISRIAMKKLVSKVPYFNLIEICSNATQAIHSLNKTQIDIMFLDIEMPDIDGLELINTLNNPPLTILVTSKKEYALQAFESNVIDYLVKPVPLKRFFKAVTKAKDLFDKNLEISESPSMDHVFVKTKGTLIKINIKEIVWIDASGDYMTIHTLDNKHVIHSTLKVIESKLPTDKFIRIHRSYIISIDYVSAIDDNIVIIGKQLIPIGAVYKENLTKRLNLL